MDWQMVKQTAFGPLNLTHDQFWCLTISEFNELMDGWKWRDNITMEQIAWQTAHLLNIHTKRKVEVKDLLKKKAKVNRNATTAEKTKKELDELEAELVPEGVIVRNSEKAS